MADTKNEPGFITLRGFHDAGEGVAFAVAELDPGRFWVLARDAADGPFRRLHDDPIRREGAEAMATCAAAEMRRDLPDLAHANPDVRESASANVAIAFTPHDCRAREFDSAAALLPLLGGAPDAWGLAMRIAQARPWEMPGRDRPHDRRAAEASCALDSEIPF